MRACGSTSIAGRKMRWVTHRIKTIDDRTSNEKEVQSNLPGLLSSAKYGGRRPGRGEIAAIVRIARRNYRSVIGPVRNPINRNSTAQIRKYVLTCTGANVRTTPLAASLAFTWMAGNARRSVLACKNRATKWNNVVVVSGIRITAACWSTLMERNHTAMGRLVVLMMPATSKGRVRNKRHEVQDTGTI